MLRDGTTESEALVAFAGGSGITPIMSLVRTVLADSTRPVALFYANRAPESVIFSDVLAALADRHPDRLTVVHHHDCERGVVTPAAVESFVGGIGDADYYICGPAPSSTPSRRPCPPAESEAGVCISSGSPPPRRLTPLTNPLSMRASRC